MWRRLPTRHGLPSVCFSLPDEFIRVKDRKKLWPCCVLHEHGATTGREHISLPPPTFRLPLEIRDSLLLRYLRRLPGDIGGGSVACRRRPGWEYLYVCIDDASRVAYTAIHPDEAAESAVEFLWYAVAWYAALGAVSKKFIAARPDRPLT